MQIFESVGCPTCDRDIVVIVENNKITSHGVCGYCDNTHSAERLQFQEDMQRMEDQFLEHLSYEGPEAPGDCQCGECDRSDLDVCPYCGRWYTYALSDSEEDHIYSCPDCMKAHRLFRIVDNEVKEFYTTLWDVYFDELYQLHLDEMAEV